MGLQQLIQHMKGLRKYIIVSALIFGLGILLGCMNRYEGVMQSTLSEMADLTKAAEQWPNYELGLFSMLLLNNISALLFVLYGGAFFGLLPVYFLILNGMVVGHMVTQEIAKGSGWEYILSILPNGIFEWLAIILASAYGIRFGFLLLDGLISLPSQKGRARVKVSFTAFFRSLIPLMGLLLLLLFLAAGLEVFVSSRLF
ncbi:stage II sporulation protein M [Gorillibacterium timonense]|uniref:stage II sporulation protein M n=1 Tax=Gorillibacterium timonense TaxID=1689269 RepID=UPI00071CDB3B|nr:stage II sporulation protein M [Gorillibacterium timonense]